MGRIKQERLERERRQKQIEHERKHGRNVGGMLCFPESKDNKLDGRLPYNNIYTSNGFTPPPLGYDNETYFRSGTSTPVVVFPTGKITYDMGYGKINYDKKNGQVLITDIPNKRRRLKIHIVLANLFVENPENLPNVIFKDGDPENILPINLMWSKHKPVIADDKFIYIEQLQKSIPVKLAALAIYDTVEEEYVDTESDGLPDEGDFLFKVYHIHKYLYEEQYGEGFEDYWLTLSSDFISGEVLELIKCFNNDKLYKNRFELKY